jgi:hypothetical protein
LPAAGMPEAAKSEDHDRRAGPASLFAAMHGLGRGSLPNGAGHCHYRLERAIRALLTYHGALRKYTPCHDRCPLRLRRWSGVPCC